MATNKSTRYADLKARLAVLNCELLEDQSSDDHDDHYYILDRRIGKLVSICTSLDDSFDWLEAEEQKRSVAGTSRTVAPTSQSSVAAWTRGADLAIDLLTEAAEIGTNESRSKAMRATDDRRTTSVLRYLERLRALSDHRTDAAFGGC